MLPLSLRQVYLLLAVGAAVATAMPLAEERQAYEPNPYDQQVFEQQQFDDVPQFKSDSAPQYKSHPHPYKVRHFSTWN